MADDTTTPVPGSELETPRASWIWIKDSAGYASVTVTFATVAFWLTTLAYLASIIDHIGPVKFHQFDVAAASSYMVPVMTLYFSRKWVDAKMGVTQARDVATLTSAGVNPNK